LRNRPPENVDPEAGTGKTRKENRSPKVKGQLYLEAVRQALPQFIDSLTDAVLMVDRNRIVVAANRRYLEVFGGNTGDVVGTRCVDSMNCPSSRPEDEGECAGCSVLHDESPQSLIRTLPDAEGNLRRWEATLNPVFDEQGKVSHVVEVWRDISERSHLEGQLSHSERLASLGILAAGVAHEINNPMASIMAGVESLKRWLDRTSVIPSESRY
jgi:PAS domain S-box-containing protein